MDELFSSNPVSDHNRQAWDARVRQGDVFTKPAEEDDFRDPLAAVDAPGWLGPEKDLRGKELLCLAAGGGRQAPLYAAAGANVTVLDISPAMLELDRQVAHQRGLQIHTVEGSMDNLSMFDQSRFDVVIQPVSTCYVTNIIKVYQQIANVTRNEGLYISQHKQPVSLQASTQPSADGYRLSEPYYRQGPLPPVHGSPHREYGTLEFLHRWEELLGGLCRAGFVIEDLLEPLHATPDAASGSFAHRCQYIAPYVRVKARRHRGSTDTPPAEKLKID
ncbi:MAG: class I SAM-dependent methyltransferase [Pirellulaceae bacterium]|nr:class I SAM-dependent methyltransferase [Pirellulaceae bacterium]